jgi:SH3-like domain-containing protein
MIVTFARMAAVLGIVCITAPAMGQGTSGTQASASPAPSGGEASPASSTLNGQLAAKTKAAAKHPKSKPSHHPANPKSGAATAAKSTPAGKVNAPPVTPATLPASAQPASPASLGDAKPDAARFQTHFQSFHPDKVYLRTGPGQDYPIAWVYQRRNLPVQVLASYEVWRKVQDFEGAQGWVHKLMLSDRRTVIVTGAVRNLHGDPNPDSAVIARVEPGVVAVVAKCDPVWCEVSAGDYKGWLKQDEVWGLLPGEIIQ